MKLKQRLRTRPILLVPRKQEWCEDMLNGNGSRYRYVVVYGEPLGFLNGGLSTVLRKWSKPKHV